MDNRSRSASSEMDDSLIFDRYYNLSLRFLSFRPRSEKEVYNYLVKKIKTFTFAKASADKQKLNLKNEEQIIARIMQRLIEYKFIDDLEFAKWWIENRKKGFKFIKLELLQKGVSKEIIEKAAEKFDPKSKEDLLIEQLINKKSKSLKNLPKQKANEKMIAFLLRKGFDYDKIKKALRTKVC